MYDMDSTCGLYYDGKKFVSDTYRMQDDYETKVNDSQYILHGTVVEPSN